MSVIGPRRLSAAPGAVEAPVPPGVFRRALADLRDARPRTEVRLREIPAPEGQAPFAVALAADHANLRGTAIPATWPTCAELGITLSDFDFSNAEAPKTPNTTKGK